MPRLHADEIAPLPQDTAALYWQDQITLAPQWKALVGARYDVYGQETRFDRKLATLSRTDKKLSPRAGLVWQPTGMLSGLSLIVDYYDIKIKGAIIEPSGQFIINDCYLREDSARSEFCDRIEIDPTDRALISGVQAGFLNRDQESVRGIDLNTSFGYPLNVGGETIDLSLNLQANHLIERSTTTRDAAGNRTTDNFAGRFAFPSWIGRATFNVRYDDFLFTWQTRYIGDVSQDPDFVDPFSDAFGFGPDGVATGVIANTCLGSGSRNPTTIANPNQLNGIVQGDGVFCRNVGFANEWFEHTASVRWDNGDLRIIAGVRNLFNKAPPRVDSSEVLAIANTPLGGGYDLNGREFFAQLLYRF